MTTPAVTWTIDSHPVDASWREVTTTLGGYHRATVELAESAARKLGLGQGSVLKAWQANGRPMWEGLLVTGPTYIRGVAVLDAAGYKAAAEKRASRLMFKSIDPAVWEDNGSAIGFSVVGPDIIASASGTLKLIAYFPDTELNRYDNTATGVQFGIDKGGWQDAQSGGYAPEGGPYNSLKVDIAVGAAGAVTVGAIYGSGNTEDEMTASAVASTIGGILGWDTTGVRATGQNILPLDLQGAWSEALSYAADSEDWMWRVLSDEGDGPRLEFGPWEREWHAYLAAGASPDLTPIELYNRVVVNYSDGTSNPKSVAVEATPDPLEGTGLTNTYEYDLQDPQEDAELATATATNLLAHVSTQRHRGTVIVPEVEEGTPYDILPGDMLILPDWAPGEQMSGRVFEVNHSPAGTTVGIEQGTSTVSAIQNIERAAPARRRGRRTRIAEVRIPIRRPGPMVDPVPWPW